MRLLLSQDVARAKDWARQWKALASNPLTSAWGYRMKAVSERIEGKWDASVKSFQKASQNVVLSEMKPHFLIGAIDSLARAGKVSEAVRLANQLTRRLSATENRYESAAVALNAGNALLWHDKYVPARKRFRTCLGILKDEGDSDLRGSALLGLSTAELYGGHPKLAIQLAKQAIKVFESSSLTSHSVTAQENIGRASLSLGRLDDALDTFLDARKRVAADQWEAARLDEFLGDTYAALNNWHEASDAYESALANDSLAIGTLNWANVQLGLGEANRELSRTKAAREHLSTARRGYRKYGNRVWEAVSIAQLAELDRIGGSPRRALKRLETARGLLEGESSHSLGAKVCLQMAECRIDLGQDPSDLLTVAERTIRKWHVASLGWKVHHLKARNAEPAGKLKHYRKMAKSIWESRSLVSSTYSRASFLSDKSTALSDYIVELLSKATKPRVQEALSVVRNSRSAALIDEIVNATNFFSDAARQEISILREELNSSLSETQRGGPSRRSLGSTAQLAGFQRRWVELTRIAQNQVAEVASKSGDPDVVLIEGATDLYSIYSGQAVKYNLPPRALKDKLSWLRFELLGAMADPDSDPSCANKIAEELAANLIPKVVSKDMATATFCPEGVFWDVPWQLLTSLAGYSEAIVSLGVWQGQGQGKLPENPSAMVWFLDSDDLPHVKQEVDSFLRFFPNAKICDDIVSVRTAMEDSNVDVLHVAGHAKFHTTNPTFSSLFFKGGAVTSAEISMANLRVSHVVVSACDTGTVSVHNRAEPDGIVRAFLARGAALVLASTWPLDDAAAHRFVHNYYEGLISGLSFASATRKARVAVKSVQPHPYFWGPFALFGGYAL
ncbi:MAG: CHAT domain-containing protein [Chthonomonadaceae bacterium]|nr:CHAT domain-containing protein [Chthonomonadaceae bacterium]